MIQVDCVLLDIEMPIMCGLTAAKRIREWERRNSFNSVKSTCSSTIEDNSYNRLPIIAISANARPEQTNDAIMAGMDDSIAKPFRIADLIPRIDHLLDKRTGSART